MKLLTYNILEGGIGRIDPLAEVIRLSGAQVVILQETWDTDAFHTLADRVGMDRFLAQTPRSAEGAVGLLTNLEIREAVNHGPLEPRLTRSAFHAVVRNRSGTKDEELAILGVHLHPRETIADEGVRLKELEGVFALAKGFAGHPHIIAGDFNASHPGQRIDITKVRPKTRERIKDQSNEIPREVIRRILEHGYMDAHSLHHADEDFGTSFTTSHPAMRVDYFFITPDLAPRVKGCEVFKPAIGRFASDHFPVVLELE